MRIACMEFHEVRTEQALSGRCQQASVPDERGCPFCQHPGERGGVFFRESTEAAALSKWERNCLSGWDSRGPGARRGREGRGDGQGWLLGSQLKLNQPTWQAGDRGRGSESLFTSPEGSFLKGKYRCHLAEGEGRKEL